MMLEDAIRAMEIKSGAGKRAPAETQGPSGHSAMPPPLDLRQGGAACMKQNAIDINRWRRSCQSVKSAVGKSFARSATLP